MSQVAEVALNLPLYRNFDYLIPPQQTVSKGRRVEVQFGRQRLVGIVVNVKSDSEFLDKLKPISDVIDEQPVISSHLVSLVEFASQLRHPVNGFPLNQSHRHRAMHNRSLHHDVLRRRMSQYHAPVHYENEVDFHPC